MSVLQVRLQSGDLKADLAREAKARGVTSAEIARRLLAEGVEALRRERKRDEWIAAAEPAIADQTRWFAERGHPFAGVMPIPGDSSLNNTGI